MKSLEQADYPFVPGSHGIPFEQSGIGQKTIYGGSGAQLEYRVTDREMVIKDPSRKDCFHLDGQVDENSRALFNLYTRDRDGLRHPDFFAGRFMDFAIRNFEKSGIKIDAIMGIWLPETDNYKQFIKAYNETGRDLEAAARSTWTNKMAEANGFFLEGKSAVVLIPGEGVAATFSRLKL